MPESFTDTPLLTPRFDAAVAYALDHHRRQLRKGTAIPYASHLLAVTALVLEMGGTEDEAIGAVLHDLVEDGGGPAALERIDGEFGPRVAAIVAANSDTDEEPKPPWKARKTAYVASLAHKPADALRVSLADKLHNAQSILRDYRTEGEALWSRFKAGEGGEVRWYYRALLDGFERRREDLGPLAEPALDELRRVVDEIDALARPAIDYAYRPASYWPDDDPPEEGVRLADVSVESVLGDVMSVVAEPGAGPSEIRLSIRTEEGHDLATPDPAVVDRPLSLGELVALIDGVDLGEGLAPGLVLGTLDLNSMIGLGNEADTRFIGVGSEVYDQLGDHYDAQIDAWVMRGPARS